MSAPRPIKNMNFSVYIDRKPIQNTPPQENFLENQMNKMYPKLTTEWVDSDKVLKCQNCSSGFSMFYRKHHCRACGGVFCRTCCYKYMIIPNQLVDVPKQQASWGIYVNTLFSKVSGYDQTKSLVCNECSTKIKNLVDIQQLIKICEFLPLSDLYSTVYVNKKWYNASIHCLSKFRNIQYKSPGYVFTNMECDLLIGNQPYLAGHTSWLSMLIKAYLIRGHSISDLIQFISNQTKTTSCWDLMCSRKCNIEIDMLTIIDLIKFVSSLGRADSSHIIELVEMLIITVNPIHSNYCLLPFLTSSLGTCFSQPVLYELLDRVGTDNNFLILLSFEYNYLKNKIIKEPIEHALNLFLKDRIPPDLKVLIYKTINVFTKLYSEKNKFITTNQVDEMLPIIYPFDTDYVITRIVEITELQSSSKPLLVKLWIKRYRYSEPEIEKRVILKSDPNLRKENIVSCLIMLLQNKLIQQMERGRIDPFDPIPTYKIILLSQSLGIIEFLDDCLTLKNISNKNYTLQNYILDNNKDDKISTIKERFARSLAISSCLSFILGLGDRHSSNIMISKKGHIIHIDYGYILENPLHSTIFNHPVIRISNEMIDFLGGVNGDAYQLFKKYIIDVFDIMRLYSDIIVHYYSILGHEKIINWDLFKEKLIDRFMNGMSIRDVEVVLIDVIQTSSNSYGGSIIDLCNEYGGSLKRFMSY